MATVKIKPLADRVLIEPTAAEEKTATGIIIPDTAKEKPQKGTVVAVGPGTKDEKVKVKIISDNSCNYDNSNIVISKCISSLDTK